MKFDPTYPVHHLVKCGHISRCQVCDSARVHLVLDLGHQPMCGSMLTKERLDQPEKAYPLRMYWCEDCSLAQIDYCVDGSEVFFPDYPYRSGITRELYDYQVNISRSLISRYGLSASDLVVDVGSNDGTLLSGFKRDGIRVLGVEPTKIAKYAREAGIDTEQDFFTIKTAARILDQHGPASLITSTNMFAHMATIGEVVKGLELLLRDDGVFVSETHYLLDVILGGQFDTVYHEHLRTYSLRSLIRLFDFYDFTVIDVERGSRYGGNIRVHAQKGKGRAIGKNVADLLKLERDSGLYDLPTYQKFAQRVERAKFEFLSYLIRLRREGKSVVGNSCPGRCSTLFNYYGIGPDWIPYLAEQPTSLKLDMYLPGKHIPVVNNEILIREQPDYVVLLAWHYAVPIMEQLRARGLKSNFIIPLPDFTVVENKS